MESCSSGSLLLSMMGFTGKPLPHTEHWVKKNHLSLPGLAAHLRPPCFSPFMLYSQEQVPLGELENKIKRQPSPNGTSGHLSSPKIPPSLWGRWRSRQWAGHPDWPQDGGKCHLRRAWSLEVVWKFNKIPSHDLQSATIFADEASSCCAVRGSPKHLDPFPDTFLRFISQGFPGVWSLVPRDLELGRHVLIAFPQLPHFQQSHGRPNRAPGSPNTLLSAPAPAPTSTHR